MTPNVSFGVEFETEAEPHTSDGLTRASQYTKFATALTRTYGFRAVGNTSSYKYPGSYDKWWITHDSSLSLQPNNTSGPYFIYFIFIYFDVYLRESLIVLLLKRYRILLSSRNGIRNPSPIFQP